MAFIDPRQGAVARRQVASGSRWPGGLLHGWRFWLPGALLVAGLILLIYGPALHGTWIGDDGRYIPDNALLKNSQGLWKFWFQPGSWVEYYPIEETVLWLEWHLWHDDTLGYHLVNVVLHIINSLLVWRFLHKFGLRFAWLGGIIFAVHPMQVESVAWMCELKNTLSLPFFLLAMSAWVDFEQTREKRDYIAALGLFLVAMLCKITMAPFPIIILLYAWWKRGRIGLNDLKASLPFFIISIELAFSTMSASNTYLANLHDEQAPIVAGSFLSRAVGAGQILAFYFSQFFLPVEPLMIHPKWIVDPLSPTTVRLRCVF